MSTNNTDTNTNEKSGYFDLHTSGIGYLNRAREIKPTKGAPYLAVTVAALRGKSDAVEYTYIDCRVSGEEAKAIVRRLMPDIADKKAVLVAFRIGDIFPESFVYKSGAKQGQPGVSVKGRLIKIGFAKVDGVEVDLSDIVKKPESAPQAAQA